MNIVSFYIRFISALIFRLCFNTSHIGVESHSLYESIKTEDMEEILPPYKYLRMIRYDTMSPLVNFIARDNNLSDKILFILTHSPCLNNLKGKLMC